MSVIFRLLTDGLASNDFIEVPELSPMPVNSLVPAMQSSCCEKLFNYYLKAVFYQSVESLKECYTSDQAKKARQLEKLTPEYVYLDSLFSLYPMPLSSEKLLKITIDSELKHKFIAELMTEAINFSQAVKQAPNRRLPNNICAYNLANKLTKNTFEYPIRVTKNEFLSHNTL